MSNVRHGDVGDWRLDDQEFLASFHLPSPGLRHEALAHENPMPFEHLITFDEVEHVYTFSGKRVPRSVTKLLHTYSQDFDPLIALSIMKPETRQDLEAIAGPEDKDIIAYWRTNGEIQRARGQLLHYHAEQILNGRSVEEPHSPELRQANRIIDGFILARGLLPFRTEVCLYHKKLNIAGQADLLCVDPTKRLVICDWKRSRDIRMENGFRSLKEPLEHLPDSNYWLYALQLNLYAFMLEDQYGYSVSTMYLFVVHPRQASPRIIEVPRLDIEVQLLVEHELDKISEENLG